VESALRHRQLSSVSGGKPRPRMMEGRTSPGSPTAREITL
jgi:hypothetical protein